MAFGRDEGGARAQLGRSVSLGPSAFPRRTPTSAVRFGASPSSRGEGSGGFFGGGEVGDGGEDAPAVPFWAATLQALDDLSQGEGEGEEENPEVF